MKRILITGATGNVGSEILRYLFEIGTAQTIVAGCRDVEKAKGQFTQYPALVYVPFDFEDPSTFSSAFENIDCVFLLRPPHIADVEKVFVPLVDSMKAKRVSEVIFLSVQGVEKSSVIPHSKIEKLIRESRMHYIFLRPSYFMQNLTTTLSKDIRAKRTITLPAGKALFNWIDVCNIGEAAAVLLENFDTHRYQILELTGLENQNFQQVTNLINQTIPNKIRYKNVSPLSFFLIKTREGLPTSLVLVMIMLHYLPRFQKAPQISDNYEKLTGKKPTSLEEFILRERDAFDNE